MKLIKETSYFKHLLITLVALFIATLAFLYSGLYSMGADDPHYDVTTWALETLRESSIARASDSIQVPADLNDPKRLLKGGADYNDMCAGCHLKPGVNETDFTLGLYPNPPALTKLTSDIADEKVYYQRNFWIIKHGIKASGMPAWAPGHDDERIWNMVAFIERLPSLTKEQYQVLTARGKKTSTSH